MLPIFIHCSIMMESVSIVMGWLFIFDCSSKCLTSHFPFLFLDSALTKSSNAECFLITSGLWAFIKFSMACDGVPSYKKYR